VFNFTADVDLRALDRHIGYFSRAASACPTRPTTPAPTPTPRRWSRATRAYIRKILALTGTPAKDLERETALVLDLENRIAAARARWSSCATRRPTSRRSPPPDSASSTATCSWMPS
jgi:putative endopeptidase